MSQKIYRNPRILLYLGAGASHFAGYRTFADFPVLIFDKNVRNAEELYGLPPNAERLLAAVKDSLERTDGWTTHDRFLWRLNEYKQILNLNLSDPAIQPYLGDAARLQDLHVSTTEAINVMANTTVHHYSRNRVILARDKNKTEFNQMKAVYNLYLELTKYNANPGYLPIFTTNYDMLLEDLFKEFGNNNHKASIANGLPGVTEEGTVWSPDFYLAQNLRHKQIDIFRLHGCACWFYHQPGDGDIYYHRTEATHQSVRNLCAMYPGLEREPGAGPHGYGFRKFYDLLRTCELIIFIGFSFRDDDVMHILLKILAERERDLKILVIDSMYTAHNVHGRLLEASRRSTFHSRVPDVREINALKLKFGMDNGFARKIINKCNKLLEV